MEFLQERMGSIIEFPQITGGPPERSTNVQSEDLKNGASAIFLFFNDSILWSRVLFTTHIFWSFSFTSRSRLND